MRHLVTQEQLEAASRHGLTHDNARGFGAPGVTISLQTGEQVTLEQYLQRRAEEKVRGNGRKV